MNSDDLLALVAEILEVDSVELTDNLEDKGWDSLSSLSFIAEIDERVGIEVSADDLADAELVSDLQTLVSR